MKTFGEFILEANKHNILDGKHYFVFEGIGTKRPELPHHTDADRAAWDAKKTQYDDMPAAERVLKGIYVLGRNKNTGIQKYGFKNKKTRANQQTRKRDLTHPDDMEQGNKKEEKIKSVGLETHHINPLHKSEKLKASMSPEEWAERVRKDAENKIYHGHHHKNLMGTVVSKTPERFRKRGILHRSGGAHELEAKTKDLYSRSVSHKDLLSAAQRVNMGVSALAKLRKEKGLLSPRQKKGQELASRMSAAYDKKVDDATT
jgi:hypothetical protein